MKEIENKKTSKISNAILEEENLSTRISDDQLQGEFNYSQAEKILKKMLNMGLIDEVEFNCKWQVLFHKFWQLFFHNYRHFIFHIF